MLLSPPQVYKMYSNELSPPLLAGIAVLLFETQLCIEKTGFVFETPGTAGGPGGRDRTLAVKSRKIVRKISFFP